MKTLFAADLHFGQARVCQHRPEFTSVEHHDETIFENIHKELNKNTTLYLLGDIVMSEPCFKYTREFRRTGARLILIPGNHCTEKFSMQRLACEYDEIHGTLSNFGCWLTHQPIHPDHLRGRICIHGHLHNDNVDDQRYINVSLEQTGYEVMPLEEIRFIINSRISSGLLKAEDAARMKLK